ncbi:MAG TPA: dUTP diphosphatase [Candidatus Paceibacterota bacterium]|nr:dUTP diphosphatase [Candidatus Paceibacterota bacterium]
MELPIKRFDQSVPLPQYKPGAACFDLFCREAATIAPGEIKLMPVNFALAIPHGYALLVFVRSSTPWKKGLMSANGVGVVDPFYCGDKDEVLIELYNFTDKSIEVAKGERLAQGMIVKFESVTWKEQESLGNAGNGGYKATSEEASGFRD